MSEPVKEKHLGRYVLNQRMRRGYTQEVFSVRSGLAADTIRRLEHGSFSPSLLTLRKVCSGLDIRLTTLFYALDLGVGEQPARELADLISSQPPRVQTAALVMLRELFELLDGEGGS